MDLSFLIILAVIMVVTTVISFGFFMYLKYREGEEPENAPIIENYMPQYSEGHTDGIVSDLQIGEKRIRVEMYSRDINYIKEMSKDKHFKLKPFIIFYDKKQVDVYGIGGFSTHRVKIKAYPQNVELLPEEVKQKHPEIMDKINKNAQLTDESVLLQQRLSNLQKIASQTFGGEIFIKYVEKTQEQMKDLGEQIKREEKKSWDQPRK